LGHHELIRANDEKCPKRHEKAVKELKEIISKWMVKYKPNESEIEENKTKTNTKNQ